ncbi:MAG: polyamine ABC transporter ATP-binding protein [Geminicoccaceae bacterium]|nr:polyamine ABC transporter ATP-binding protein [Geminicoccaceae bacterium]
MATARPVREARPRIEPWQDPDAVPFVRIQGVTKTFGEVYAVDNVTLDIYQGEFFALLGPSGCGKSTLLRILAGLERPTSGRILIDGQDMTAVPPWRRPVNMMFQSYALFPHLSVRKNIAFGLEQERLPRAEIAERVAEMVRLVRLEGLEDRKPDQLSGGQKQRVALARALVKRPKVLLLDEPLGALDKKLRDQTQLELVNIQDRLGLTFVIVTHDQEEAMTVGSRMAIMREGHIAQIGTPSEIYEYPTSRFVAEFVGEVNIIEARFASVNGSTMRLRAPALGIDVLTDRPVPALPGEPLWVAVRPEKMSIAKTPPPEHAFNCVAGEVFDIEYLGDVSVYHVRLDNGAMLRATEANKLRLIERPITWEDRVWLFWGPDASVVLKT